METNNDLLHQIAGADQSQQLTNNQLLEIIANNGGGGGGSSASNGLHVEAGDIKLGGDITETTQIVGRGNNVLIINNPLSEVGTNQVMGFAVNGNTSAQILALSADGSVSNVFDMTPTSTSICLFSPNGTKYQLEVSDEGVVTAIAA
jgi:hypothetical protein